MRTTIAAVIALVACSASGQAASGDVPPALTGDWYASHLACGTPKSDVSGVRISPHGQIVDRLGAEACQTSAWRGFGPQGEGSLGTWSYEATCTAGKRWYGSARLSERKAGLALQIEEYDKDRGGQFDKLPPAIQSRGWDLIRCPSR